MEQTALSLNSTLPTEVPMLSYITYIVYTIYDIYCIRSSLLSPIRMLLNYQFPRCHPSECCLTLNFAPPGLPRAQQDGERYPPGLPRADSVVPRARLDGERQPSHRRASPRWSVVPSALLSRSRCRLLSKRSVGCKLERARTLG